MTVAELAAAQAFRAGQRFTLSVKNDNDPPGVTVSVFAGNIRHDCPARGGASVFLEMREHYVRSPEAVVHMADDRVYGVALVDDGAGESWPEAEGFEATVVPAGRFAFIWTQGRCAACSLVARSGTGRLVDTRLRPPSRRAHICVGGSGA